MFCIFDGHHGRNAAEQAKALLPAQLLIHLPAAAVAVAAASAADVDSSTAAAGGGGGAGAEASSLEAAACMSSQGMGLATNSEGSIITGGVSSSSSGDSSTSATQQQQQQQQQLLGHHTSTRAGWEAAFLATDGLLSSDDGCTATALLVEAMENGNVVVQVANVGDSEALLVDMAR